MPHKTAGLPPLSTSQAAKAALALPSCPRSERTLCLSVTPTDPGTASPVLATHTITQQGSSLHKLTNLCATHLEAGDWSMSKPFSIPRPRCLILRTLSASSTPLLEIMKGYQRLNESTQQVPHLLDWASCKPAWPVPKASAPARALMRPLPRPRAASTSSRSGLSATSFTIALLQENPAGEATLWNACKVCSEPAGSGLHVVLVVLGAAGVQRASDSLVEVALTQPNIYYAPS